MKPGSNDGRRIARAEKEVQQAVAQYILHGMRDRLPGLVTISQVRMPADLRAAKVFVSVLGTEQEKDMVMEMLHNQAREVQRYLGENLRMRYCPKLTFYSDTTTESVLKVERILQELKEKQQTPESENEE